MKTPSKSENLKGILQQKKADIQNAREEKQHLRQQALKEVIEIIHSLQPELEDIAKKLKIPKAFEFQLDIPVPYGAPGQEYSKIQMLDLSIRCHQPPTLEIVNEKEKNKKTYTTSSPQEATNHLMTHITQKLDLLDQIYEGKKPLKQEVSQCPATPTPLL